MKSKLYKCQRRIEELSNGADDSHSLPVCARMILTETLIKLRVPFTTVPYSSIRPSIALASLLDCPVLANSSDYFVLTSREELKRPEFARVPPYVPLRFLAWNPFPIATGSGYMLSAHAYLPHRSELKQIAPRNRSILGLLLGSNCMPRSRLPHQLREQYDNSDSSEHPKSRRWHMVYNWLVRFPANSDEPLEQLLESHPIQNRIIFLKQFLECLGGFIYDPHTDAFEIMKQFRILPVQNALLSSSDAIVKPEPPCRDLNLLVQATNSLLRGGPVSDVQRFDYTTNWPDRLVRAYRMAKFCCAFLNPIYSRGLCMPVRVEDPSCDTSVYDAALPLRVMHYCLFLSLEQHLGSSLSKKLIGLTPHATEYSRRGNQLVAYELVVSPLSVQFERDYTDRLLSSFFDTTFPSEAPEPGWSFALAVTLAIWHSNVPTRFRARVLNQCPFTLAILALAVVTMHEQDSLNMDVLNHLTQCSETLEKDLGKLSKPKEQRLSFSHQFTGVQLIYNSLQSLVHLLEAILPITHESELFHFCPMWTLFPSGRLLCLLASKIELELPERRLAVVRRFWIPRLYRVKANISVSTAELREISTTFDEVVKTVSSVKIEIKPIKFNIREVDKVELFSSPAPAFNSTSLSKAPVNKSGPARLPNMFTQRTDKPFELYTPIQRHTEPFRNPLSLMNTAKPPAPYNPKRGGAFRGRQSTYTNRLMQRLEAVEKN